MFKRFFSLVSILFLLQANYLFSQDVPLPDSPVPVPGFTPQFLHGQSVPPIFFTLNQGIPEKVLKARDESVVAIRVGFPVIRADQGLSEDAWYGAGFTVWENYVVTNLHLFGNQPGLWYGTKEFPTRPQVFDGSAFFNAQLVFYDYTSDLAFLKVETPNASGENFSKKPVKLLKMNTTEKDGLELLGSYENFYAFAPYVSSPNLFFTLQLGPFRSITNSIDGGYFLSMPVGIIEGNVQPGFSGGPLFSPNGEVAGVVTRTSTIFTFVILAETIHNFFMTSAAHLGLDVIK